jgi:hypothetical protein
MDKLETFFIRTVTTAQQQAQTTSGAVSTTKIGNFLTEQKTVENMLDKLVSAPISRQVAAESTATEKVAAAETAKPQADEQLLSKLTASSETPETQAVTREKIETEPVETPTTGQEQVREDVLDKLTGGSGVKGRDKDKTEKPQAGDSGDA